MGWRNLGLISKSSTAGHAAVENDKILTADQR
jgi:hypothetical protein